MNRDRYGEIVEPEEATPAEKAMAIVNCDLCDDNGYRGVVVCDHVDRAEVARRGLEKCREVLARGRGRTSD